MLLIIGQNKINFNIFKKISSLQCSYAYKLENTCYLVSNQSTYARLIYIQSGIFVFNLKFLKNFLKSLAVLQFLPFFNVLGLDVIVTDDVIVGALENLPEQKRDIILLFYPLIVLASSGDVDAINVVLKHYEVYIAALFTRQGVLLVPLLTFLKVGWRKREN